MKFRQREEGEYINTILQLSDQEKKQFWSKIWQRREDDRNAKWINKVGRRVRRSPRKTVGENTPRLRATLKEVPH